MRERRAARTPGFAHRQIPEPSCADRQRCDAHGRPFVSRQVLWPRWARARMITRSRGCSRVRQRWTRPLSSSLNPRVGDPSAPWRFWPPETGSCWPWRLTTPTQTGEEASARFRPGFSDFSQVR
jgi:hypothetical protein